MNSSFASASRFKIEDEALLSLTFLTLHSCSETCCSSFVKPVLASSSCLFSSPMLFFGGILLNQAFEFENLSSVTGSVKGHVLPVHAHARAKWNAIFMTFLFFSNDVISLATRHLIFVYLSKLTRSIQEQIVEYDITRTLSKALSRACYNKRYNDLGRIYPHLTYLL